MVSRRTVMTGGMFGGLSTMARPGEGEVLQDREALLEIAREVKGLGDTADHALLTNSVAHGFVPQIREQFTVFLRANGKFPDYCEIGVAVFYDLFDWHVKHGQPLAVTRQPDGRYAMQFMFTLLLLRQESDPKFIGYPYDQR